MYFEGPVFSRRWRREELTTGQELLARTAFKAGMMRTFVVINRVVGFIHARRNY